MIEDRGGVLEPAAAATADVRELVLGSGSQTRRRLLLQAGFDFRVAPAAIDERAVQADWLARHPGAEAGEVAGALAEAKACHVASHHTAAVVIGADQVLSFKNQIINKAASPAILRDQLLRLRGERHYLYSAIAIHADGEVVWRCVDRAELTMRRFSLRFLDMYLAAAGDSAREAVGGYQLEGLGIQLFERIEGDYFTILGLPMLPLMAELRRLGVAPS